jgi:IclR family KDG regulon transcriptional repressor
LLTTVQKIGPVLDLFTPEKPEWRMSDVARALDIPKSSTYSLMTTLVDIGLLSVTDSGRYHLGWYLLSLSERMRAGLGFRQFAAGPMKELSQTLKETVLLSALDRQEVVYLDRVEGTHPMVRLAGVRPGARLPVQATAAGKVLLAYRDLAEVRVRMTNVRWRQLTPTTVTDLDTLEGQLLSVRANGVAIDRGEVVPDVACVAAPITDRYGSVVAAMSVSMPAYRFPRSESRIVELLKGACRRVSVELATAQEEDGRTDASIALVA